jgi:hypothetical protein
MFCGQIICVLDQDDDPKTTVRIIRASENERENRNPDEG